MAQVPKRLHLPVESAFYICPEEARSQNLQRYRSMKALRVLGFRSRASLRISLTCSQDGRLPSLMDHSMHDTLPLGRSTLGASRSETWRPG